jgi:hypothetical protein
MYPARLDNQAMQMACERNDEIVGNDETEGINVSAFELEGNEDLLTAFLATEQILARRWRVI